MATETRQRTLAKTIVWRLIGIVWTWIGAYLILLLAPERYRSAAALSTFIVVYHHSTRMAMYYAHERVWAGIRWGKSESDSPNAPISEPASRTPAWWGVGPVIGVLTIGWAGLMLLAEHLFLQSFYITGVTGRVFATAGVVLLALGIPLYVAVVLYFRSHRGKQGVVTTGPYARVRHPLYAIWVFFIAPGAVLLLRSWLLLTVPLVMYVAARVLVRLEERRLLVAFGNTYAEYMSRTGALLPGRVSSTDRPAR